MYRPVVSFTVDYILSGYSRPDDPDLIRAIDVYQSLLQRRIDSGMNPLLAFMKTYERKGCRIKVVPRSYRLDLISDDALASQVTQLSNYLEYDSTNELKETAEALLQVQGRVEDPSKDLVALVSVLNVLRGRALGHLSGELTQYCHLLLFQINVWLAGLGSHLRIVSHRSRSSAGAKE